MSISFKNILIVAKHDHRQAKDLGKETCTWFKNKGFSYRFITTTELVGLQEIDFSPSLVLVLGGDGTLLYVARKFLNLNIPLMGINFGRVGFLAELGPESWESYFTELFILGQFHLSKRIALCYVIKRDGKDINKGCAINDVVISRDGMARLLELSIVIGTEAEPIRFRADGVILSTPNGSTGYCAAAGGSLIYPGLDVIEICPICPFLSGIRPLIIPGSSMASIEINEAQQSASLTIDGQEEIGLCAGDRVEVSRHERELHFLMPRASSYIKKLKDKGYI